MPTRVTVPPGRARSIAARRSRPDRCTRARDRRRRPHRLRRRKSSVGAGPVAPARASPALSMAVTGSAPCATAPMTALRPTPPRPMTTTDSPACTLRRVTDGSDPGRHRAADERGDLGGVRGSTLIAADAATTCRSPNVPMPLYAPIASPLVPCNRTSSGAAGGRCRRAGCTATARRAACLAGAHGAVHASTTRSPTARSLDALADLLDPCGALVAHHDAGRPLPLAVHDVEVGVADPRCRHPDPHLASLRRVEGQLFDLLADPGPRKTTPRVLIGLPSTRPMLAPGRRKAGHTARPPG